MRTLPFTSEQVRSFIAVTQAGNVSRAAQALSLTQSAVTQQIRHFERALGLQLLERTPRGVRVTPAGADVAQACVVAARDLEAIEDTARLHRALEIGSLRLGVSPTCGDHYAPPLLASFVAAWPRVRIQVISGNTPTIAAQVASAELDCGLVEGSTPDPRLERRELYHDSIVVAVASTHALAAAGVDVRSELHRHAYLGREATSATEAIAEELLGSRHAAPPRIEFTHLDTVRAATVAGLGFAVLPEVAILDALNDGRLVRLAVAPKVRRIAAIRRAGTRLPSVDAFWSILPGAGAGQSRDERL